MHNEAIERLTACGIKPSAQRISIMEYLLKHRTHPTVDMIYNDLVPTMPTLSRTTIYNTLKLLEEHNAIIELRIDKKTSHYDGDTLPHSHFQCKSCGKIIDVQMQGLLNEQYETEFVIEETEINYRGYCKSCLEKATKTNN